MLHICVGELSTIGSGNGSSPVWRQAITGTNGELFPFGPSETNFSEIRIKIVNFSFKKMHVKMSSAKSPFCSGLNELMPCESYCNWLADPKNSIIIKISLFISLYTSLLWLVLKLQYLIFVRAWVIVIVPGIKHARNLGEFNDVSYETNLWCNDVV